MGKMAMLRHLFRPPAATVRSTRSAAVSATRSIDGQSPLSQDTARSIFTLSCTSTSSDPPRRRSSGGSWSSIHAQAPLCVFIVFGAWLVVVTSTYTMGKRFPPVDSEGKEMGCYDNLSAFAKSIGSTRFFSEDVAHFPEIKDPEIKNVFKDFIAANWDELPESLIHDAKAVLSKDTDDKTGKEALANVFRSAEAVEEFIGILVSLKMELDDSVGLSGEDVKPLPDKLVNALRVAYSRYTTYLDSFGPDESYLRKKIESELGTRMIHLKMRCSGIGSEWGKVTVLGTSGISGSYVEQRAA
ncbi:Succinate dehydrogenase subunit 5, mitochondrial-like protein [Drosera capensis]